MDSESLRVSKPGVDVTTATESELTFNSKWSTLSLLQKGSFVNPAPSTSPGNNTKSTTVYYDRTYVTRPIIFFGVLRHSWGGIIEDPSKYIREQHVGPHAKWFTGGCYTQWHYTTNVLNDRFVFTSYLTRNCDGSYHGYECSVDYLIWDYDL